MPTKTCKRCLIEKDYSEFDIAAKRKDGRWEICKDCRSTSPSFRAKHKEKMELLKEGKRRCRSCKKIKTLDLFLKDKSSPDGYSGICNACNTARTKKAMEKDSYKKWRAEYVTIVDWSKYYPQMALYRETHAHERYAKDYERKKQDPLLLFAHYTRSHINMALNKYSATKVAPTIDLLGCSIEFYYNHIESQFTEGMSWENKGRYGWHVDHIIPLKAFDLSDPKQQFACFNWRNARPMWGRLNLSKGSKYKKEDFDEYMKLFL